VAVGVDEARDHQVRALDPVVGRVTDEDLAAGQKGSPHPRRVEVLPMPRLRRVDCSSAGIRRVGRGRGFSYEEADGEPIVDREVIERIRELAIPPAWKDVWICPHPNGHIQATGVDAAGRKQYLYHPKWREDRDREKFEEMETFAKSLPAMRERTAADLRKRGLVRDRVLACAVQLLDLGFFRIGSERYTEENETFGLSTLRRKHVEVTGEVASFKYKAKGSIDHDQKIADPLVVPTIKALLDRDGGGYELLAYREGRSGWADVKASEINEYLKEVTGGDYSAKDFRTWNATVLAAADLAENGHEAATKTARKRAATAATKRVARYLSNTPAVCRQAYIDPRVFDRYDSGETIHTSLKRMVSNADPGEFVDRERIEQAVLRLIA
jgi:DNA topoisomerase I